MRELGGCFDRMSHRVRRKASFNSISQSLFVCSVQSRLSRRRGSEARWSRRAGEGLACLRTVPPEVTRSGTETCLTRMSVRLLSLCLYLNRRENQTYRKRRKDRGRDLYGASVAKVSKGCFAPSLAQSCGWKCRARGRVLAGRVRGR